MAGNVKTKTDVKKRDRKMLNTTINEKVLEDFRTYCKETGMPMNMILEAFMSQFSSGELILKIGKANKLIVDISDEDENKEVV